MTVTAIESAALAHDVIADMRDRISELEAALEHERRLNCEVVAFTSFQRFHAFDAIKDDRCPACGGYVRVIEDEKSVRLEAIR